MKKLICMIFVIFMIASCTQTPKEIIAPLMKIDNTGSVTKVIVEFSIYNDTSSVVFIDYSGEMTFKTVDGKELFKKDFKIPKIFPYTTETAVVESELSPDKLAILAEASQIEKTELDKKSVIEDVFITEQMISLDKISVKKSDIKDVLKGK
ncbi:MAG: hypothetical protein JW982_02845 [Spirochaetes bacterium]|nr:hypothetical protein [Spirochaetota bacterium]